MAAVTIGIADVEDTKKRMRRAVAGHGAGAFIGFASVELMWKVITPKRWELMRAIAGAGPLAIREIARRVEHACLEQRRDIAVHGLHVEFPYDEIHVDFVLRGP